MRQDYERVNRLDQVSNHVTRIFRRLRFNKVRISAISAEARGRISIRYRSGMESPRRQKSAIEIFRRQFFPDFLPRAPFTAGKLFISFFNCGNGFIIKILFIDGS
jgi:hypothetical protein